MLELVSTVNMWHHSILNNVVICSFFFTFSLSTIHPHAFYCHCINGSYLLVFCQDGLTEK